LVSNIHYAVSCWCAVDFELGTVFTTVHMLACDSELLCKAKTS